VAYPVYSVVIFREAGVQGSRDVMVPAGYRWVLRDAMVYANNSLTESVHLFVSELPTGALLLWEEYQPSERSMHQWHGHQVIEYNGGAGGLRITNDASAGVDLSLSGYLLQAPN